MRTCPFCGTENEPFFRFCLGCGEDLDKVFAAPPPAPPTPEVIPEARPVVAPAGVGSPAASKGSARRPTTNPAVVEAPPPPPVAPAPEPPVAPPLPPAEALPRAAEARQATAGPPGPRVSQPASRRTRRRVARASLIQVFDDGTEEPVAEISTMPLIIGRSDGAYRPEEGPWDPSSEILAYPEDDFMAPRHAVLFLDFDGVLVEPLESTNGVFMEITEPHACGETCVFRVGQQLLRVDHLKALVAQHKQADGGLLGSPIPDSAWGRLAQVLTPSQLGEVHLLGGPRVRLGRERGDINFGTDLFVSGLHAELRLEEGEIVLEDMDSSNGTFVRISEPTRLGVSSSILVGQQIFRVEIEHS